MTYPSSPNFSKHSQNLAAVVSSLKQVERVHKRAIREGDAPSELAMRRVHTLLVGVFAESCLRKIVEDPTGFNARERSLIWARGSQDARWIEAVECAARRHYGVLQHETLAAKLPEVAMGRIETVQDLLAGELGGIITDRNKLAHGQWVWQLKSRSDAQFLTTQMAIDYNYLEIKSRHDIIECVAKLVHILCVSEPTFTRDFDDLQVRIDAARSRLTGLGFEQFRLGLRKRRQVLAPPAPE